MTAARVLPVQRGKEVTTVLSAGATDVSIDVSPLTVISAFWVKSCTGTDVKAKMNSASDGAISISASDPARNELEIAGLYLSSVAGATVVIEFQGR